MTLPDVAWKQKLRRRVLTWFRRNARDLPWRESRDPYRVWISEIMLQQTQVATVVPYFKRFIEAFPTVESLATAREERVLRLWEGLGYYRRARQLHRAAKVLVAEHQGLFPTDAAALQTLPGIGRYTAGAIASIAFDAKRPILEANTIRLFCRLLAFRGDYQSRDAQTHLWEFAESILPTKQVGAFNQGLMELGSTVCTVRNPDCARCPLAPLCPTQAAGLQAAIPAAARRTKYEAVDEVCVVVRRKGEILLRRCQDKERWAGLWDFPRFSVEPADGANRKPEHMAGEVTRQVKRLTGVTITSGQQLTTIKHGVTRFRITLTCFSGTYRRGDVAEGACWVTLDRLRDFPLSVTGRRIAKLLTGSD